ncbi:hypothetical protein M9458_055511 [Cirrhinus mrigala]|uniref:C-type lectin domain-containing protein n=1 Tax=Cirrhinus mrigala TaxID=683832 RepID=A0ABD0MJU1_CIRMR
MGSTFLSFLLIIHCGVSAVTRVHIHVNEWKTWREARSYCRKNYKDLSTISSTEENLRLRQMLGGNHAWIGMHRNDTNMEQFIWSDGDLQTNFYQWKGGQPAAKDSNQDCVEVDGEGWADYGCNNHLPFFCYFTWETDNKTWEDALEHCRHHYTDLASLTTNQQLQQVKNNLMGENSIWVGLRFIAGQWHWLNGEPVANQLASSLPACPDEPCRCGAFNIMTEQWENRDCEEKLRFLCF